MTLRNTETHWGALAKTLHWLIAALIIGSSIFVLHVNDSTWWFKSTPLIFIQNINWHKLTGIVALALILVRILWRRRGPVPVTATLTPFEERTSRWTHRALYALMVLVPLFGWLSSSAFGSAVKIPGVGSLPLIWPKDRTFLAFFYWTHFVLAWTLLALVALHAAAALYHHFVKKDPVLRAMLPGRRTEAVVEGLAVPTESGAQR
jgi:cytochrome b561